jgi:hypothetical protein
MILIAGSEPLQRVSKSQCVFPDGLTRPSLTLISALTFSLVMKMSLTAEELKSFVTYDKNTGKMVRVRNTRGRSRIGVEAGSIHSCGYRTITINRKNYYIHRLAWLYVYGVWPNGYIDHINRVVSDNRIENLRECTKSQNQMNRGPQKETKTGIKNVYMTKGGTYFCAITASGITHRKNFIYLEDAIEWVEKKRKVVHGEFCSS